MLIAERLPASFDGDGHSPGVDRMPHQHSAELQDRFGGRASPRCSPARWSRRVAVDIVGLLEAAVVAFGALLTQYLAGSHPFGPHASQLAVLMAGLLMGATVASLLARQRLYDPNQMHDLPVRPFAILAVMVAAFGLMIGLGATFGILGYEALAWFADWFGVSFAILLLLRFAAHEYLRRKTREGHFNSNLAVIGSGPIADTLAAFLKSDAVGIKLVGVYDDRGPERTARSTQKPRSGTVRDLIAACRAGEVDQIIIALPQSAAARISDIAARLEQLPVALHVCSHVASELIPERTVEGVSCLGPVGLIHLKRRPLRDWGAIVKRAEDLVLAGLLTPVLLPLLGLIAIAIKLDSRGPVLFHQKRHGFNHKTLVVTKFRTMHVLEDGDVIEQARKGDARVTRIGRLLRATSLDELPQLINVLRGEMSLVGPRPHAIAHDDYWELVLAQYAGRQQVKPGITGWAQVNGLRGETETPNKMRARVDYDLHYIDNWSLWFDLKILLLTPMFGFINKNAY